MPDPQIPLSAFYLGMRAWPACLMCLRVPEVRGGPDVCQGYMCVCATWVGKIRVLSGVRVTVSSFADGGDVFFLMTVLPG